MATKEQTRRYLDFSGGLQTKTSRLIPKDNELLKADNVFLSRKIGAVSRRDGFETVGNVICDNKDVTGGGNYLRKDGTYNILAAINNSGGTNSTIKYLQGSSWTNIVSNLAVDSKIKLENFLDKAFVVGHSETANTFLTTATIDSSLTYSSSSEVYKAPKGKYVIKYNEQIYIGNCEVDGVKYPARIYQSSVPMDVITYVNTDQKGLLLQLSVDSTKYLKAGMTIDIYGAGTNQKKVDSLEIVEVLKAENKITFASTSIDVEDNDEIYLEDSKGTLGIYWNTNDPTPAESDFLEIPPVKNEIPKITGMAINNNRLLLFTPNSLRKWDGANLVIVSENIGTTSGDSIATISGWTIFFHQTGIWGYNDAQGELKLLSRGIKNYIEAIPQDQYSKVIGIAKEDIYKLYVEELGTLDARTTSTSTSSTSTSSTSSSTSSTSTSSTSTSSTSLSTSSTSVSVSSSTSKSTSTSISVSTSSTSLSTSSTSLSTTSTSLSISVSTSSSTSLSTSSSTSVISGFRAARFIYDFSLNAWTVDYINRKITCNFLALMHGYEKIYFGDSSGRLFRDDTGFTDAGYSIPFDIETKRFHLDLPEETKRFRYAYIYTDNGNTSVLSVSIDGGQWISKGQLNKEITRIELKEISGRDIAFKITQNNAGDPVVFNGVSIIWILEGRYDASS